jgi:hypothetical protein
MHPLRRLLDIPLHSRNARRAMGHYGLMMTSFLLHYMFALRIPYSVLHWVVESTMVVDRWIRGDVVARNP